jgi:hypothetical protein
LIVALWPAFFKKGAHEKCKARLIEDMLKIGPFDPRWCMPKILEMNPLALLISIG